MAAGLMRDQLIHLILEFEEDLRSLLRKHVLTVRNESQVFRAVKEKLDDRKRKEARNSDEALESLYFLDLSDEIELLRTWAEDLPHETRVALRAINDPGRLIRVRNLVMHARPLAESDRDFTVRTLDEVSRKGIDGPRLRAAIQRLENDPHWSPSVVEIATASRVLHNIPRADFEDIGLIGRVEEQADLLSKLLELPKKRSRILTLVGQGGVGKTALALQVLDNLIYDQSCPYDLVAWVSLKTEDLTAQGVEAVANAVTDLVAAASVLIRPMDDSSQLSSADELSAALDGLTSLIVIDNIETVDGSEVIDFTDAMPEGTSFLLTSRIGLGQLERVVPLLGLKEERAAHLLRCLFENLGETSYSKTENSLLIRDFVRHLGTAPLALRWFATGVASGSDPHFLIQNKELVVRFCIENVFESLDETSKHVARIMAAVNDPLMAAEIGQFMDDFEFDAVRRSLQAFVQRNLVRVSARSGTTHHIYELDVSLREYVERFSPLSQSEMVAMRRADETRRREAQKRREWSTNNPFSPSAMRGGDEHLPAQTLLVYATRILHNSIQALDTATFEKEITTLLNRATDIDASYWENYRVAGYIYGQSRQIASAEANFKKALELAQTETDCAFVHYWHAQFLTSISATERAVEHARRAHEVLDDPHSAVTLAQPLMHLGNLDEPEQLLIGAMASEHSKTRIIAATTLLDLRRRKAEAAYWGKDFVSARDLLKSCFDLADDAKAQGQIDDRINKHLAKTAAEALSVARSFLDGELVKRAVGYLREIPEIGTNRPSFDRARAFARQILDDGLTEPELCAALESILGEGSLGELNTSPTGPTSRRLKGVIRNWMVEKGYGFIESDDIEEDIFLWQGDLRSGKDLLFMTQGRPVEFTVRTREKGSQAFDVELAVPPLADEQIGRSVVVTSYNPTRIIARDTRTGTLVIGVTGESERFSDKTVPQVNSVLIVDLVWEMQEWRIA
ncbi:unannotated protein [freshwater metagenome]|uniref:Unannotated protein n=1 Tax=freshwater metagenome TaxID=449393 RepID=A0A6J7JF92_9ZZZZ